MKHCINQKHIRKTALLFSIVISLLITSSTAVYAGDEDFFLGVNLGITSGIDYSANTDEGSQYERTETHHFANVGGVGRISAGLLIYSDTTLRQDILYVYGEAGFVYIPHKQRSTGGISDMTDEYTLMRSSALLGIRAYLKARSVYFYTLVGPEFTADYYQVNYDSSRGLGDVNFWKFYFGGGFGLGMEIPFRYFSLDISGRYHLVNSPYFDMTVGLNYYF